MEKIKMITKLNEMCKKYDRKDYPGIAVGVVENGELIFSKGYGEANLDYNIPIDENTVFHACSMAKQFTAACIALLIEEGKLSLDHDVSSILPQLKDCGEKVTIYNLLYMTNGIPDVYDTANFVCGIREDEGITRDEFWKYVTACDWKFFKPGEKWSYGNTGYFLLGQIIEAVTKTSLSQYADEHIFKPLGMNNTFIRDDRTKIIKNRAVGYSNYDHVHFNDSYKRYTSRNDKLSINEENVEVGGAGQIWTTIRDLLLWDKNFYNNILGRCVTDEQHHRVPARLGHIRRDYAQHEGQADAHRKSNGHARDVNGGHQEDVRQVEDHAAQKRDTHVLATGLLEIGAKPRPTRPCFP